MNLYMRITWFIFAPILCLFYIANAQAAAPTRPFFLIPRLVKGDSRAVTLSWQPPREPNGRITKYDIYYTDNPRQVDSRWSEVLGVYNVHKEVDNGPPYDFTIHNLDPSTLYYFKVRAYNSNSASGFSDIANIKTLPEEETKPEKKVLEESPAEFMERNVNEYGETNGFKTTFPSLMDSQPLQVNVSLSLVNIASARINRNEVEINTWLTLTWQYPGLQWDLQKPLNRYTKYGSGYDEYWMDHFTLSPSKLWTPDVVPLSLSRPVEPLTPSLLRVNHTGHVTWRVKYRMYTNCAVGARRSSCDLRIGSLTHGVGVMALNPVKGDIEFSQYFKDSKYKVLKSSMKVTDGAIIDAKFTFRKA